MEHDAPLAVKEFHDAREAGIIGWTTTGTKSPPDQLSVKLLIPGAQVPRKQTAGAAGVDLCVVEHITIPKGTRCLARTGIALALPTGTYGRIAPRSGLAVKHGVDVGAGVIDSDFRGEIKVLLINNGTVDLNIEPGTRVAQLLVEHLAHVTFVQSDSLPETVRNDGGFGSTGA